MKNIKESIICAGFGGQGIMVLGKVIANCAMESGLNVTYLPAYGAEVRGGTAHSMVRISSENIGSPYVAHTETAIVLNNPSLAKFESRIDPGGLLILNTSMVTDSPTRKDIEVVAAPLTDVAMEIGNVKVANVIAAGIFFAKKDIFDKSVIQKVIELMAKGREKLIPINMKAIEKGAEIANK